MKTLSIFIFQKQVTKEYFLYFHLLNESTYYMDGNYDQDIVDDYYDEYASETENMVYSKIITFPLI